MGILQDVIHIVIENCVSFFVFVKKPAGIPYAKVLEMEQTVGKVLSDELDKPWGL
jgi:hypothetical protein